MKKVFLILMLAAWVGWTAKADVTINSSTFPDNVFRAFISSNYDTNSNGVLSTAELATATNIDLNGKGVTNLTGIISLPR